MNRKLVLALLTLTVACGGRPGTPGLTPSRAPIAHTRIIEGGVVNSGFETATNLVITDAGHWQSVWQVLHPGGMAPAIPTIDFTEEAVVLVAIGQQPNGGHSVRIDSVYRGGRDSVVVRAIHLMPGPDCVTTQALVEPVDLVRIPRPSLPVRFLVRTDTYSCDQ